ncbi:MAG: GerW family sporulation protein [Bacillota bacterium]
MDHGTMLETMAERLERFVSTKTVIGEPIVVGNVTLVPVQTATFGFGSGGGEGKREKDTGAGGGAGGGASLRPIAIVAVVGDDVRVFTLGKKDMIEQLTSVLPDVLSKIKIAKNKDKGDEQGDSQGED